MVDRKIGDIWVEKKTMNASTLNMLGNMLHFFCFESVHIQNVKLAFLFFTYISICMKLNKI